MMTDQILTQIEHLQSTRRYADEIERRLITAEIEELFKSLEPPFCSEYIGRLPCHRPARRVITFKDSGEAGTGYYCHPHAIALRRLEARGSVEIVQDEPVDRGTIPFQGEPVASL